MTTATAAPAPRPSDEEMLDAIAHLTLSDLTRVTRTLYGSIFLRVRLEPQMCVHCGYSGAMEWSSTMEHWHCPDPRSCLKRRGLA